MEVKIAGQFSGGTPVVMIGVKLDSLLPAEAEQIVSELFSLRAAHGKIARNVERKDLNWAVRGKGVAVSIFYTVDNGNGGLRGPDSQSAVVKEDAQGIADALQAALSIFE